MLPPAEATASSPDFPDFPTPDPGLSALVEEYAADLAVLKRRWRLSLSEVRLDRADRLDRSYLARLVALPFAELSPAAKIDHALLRNHLDRSRKEHERLRAERARVLSMLPGYETLAAMEEELAAMRFPAPAEASRSLDRAAAELRMASPPSDARAMASLKELRDAVARWRAFHVGYDPTLDWWVRQPLAAAEAELERLSHSPGEEGEIPGRAIGREALLEDLAFDMLPYSPEELIAIGEREYAWCLTEIKRASAELGFGDDWRAALEHTKETYLPPGQQPAMVLGLAREAEAYVAEMVTVPEYAVETWRMEMMPAEAQKTNPFFLGGENIIVSYPTDTMNLEEKRMSMRGNNPNFSRTTVQHELIPGHHLQLYMTARFRRYRSLFSTPFWIEGWTIYWELLLWDLGFPRTPEERIGMLFWRMHRCVRVVFSIRFHLGELTTAECVDMLVDRVGHERLNAEGEVRRSFNGLYPPLYQAAYLLGGLQFRAIAEELIAEGAMTRREFHDRLLRENEIPPVLMRLALRGEAPPDHENPAWRFE